MRALIYSLGWRLLRQALKWLLTADVLTAIRAAVSALAFDDEMSGSEKHAAVVKAAQALQDRATSARPKELIEIAVKAAYLELVADEESA